MLLLQDKCNASGTRTTYTVIEPVVKACNGGATHLHVLDHSLNKYSGTDINNIDNRCLYIDLITLRNIQVYLLLIPTVNRNSVSVR